MRAFIDKHWTAEATSSDNIKEPNLDKLSVLLNHIDWIIGWGWKLFYIV